MARKPRVEVEGGLYHLITRGNNRQAIFHQPADYSKFLSLLKVQKDRLPFYLYAYCLMPNHVHLLIERQQDAVGRIMHRLLTGYSQYFNRKYGKVGHALQGRHKAILCQTDRYLCELVRYIHLNPVRAKMVLQPEDYPYSSHRAYLGWEQTDLVDVDPVLRHFGRDRKAAREHYRQFVCAGIQSGHVDELCGPVDGRFLGTEEFIDATIHRLGVTDRVERKSAGACCEPSSFNSTKLLAAVEAACRVPREDFYGSGKGAQIVRAKEALIVVGREAGASMKELAELTGLNSSTVSRRYDVGKRRILENEGVNTLVSKIKEFYYRPD